MRSVVSVPLFCAILIASLAWLIDWIASIFFGRPIPSGYWLGVGVTGIIVLIPALLLGFWFDDFDKPVEKSEDELLAESARQDFIARNVHGDVAAVTDQPVFMHASCWKKGTQGFRMHRYPLSAPCRVEFCFENGTILLAQRQVYDWLCANFTQLWNNSVDQVARAYSATEIKPLEEAQRLFGNENTIWLKGIHIPTQSNEQEFRLDLEYNQDEYVTVCYYAGRVANIQFYM